MRICYSHLSSQKIMRLFIKLLFLFLFPSVLFSQSREDLLLKKQKLQDEIKEFKKATKEEEEKPKVEKEKKD